MNEKDGVMSEIVLKMMDSIESTMIAESKADRTVKMYKNTIEEFAYWLDRKDGFLISDISANTIFEYMADMKFNPSIKVRTKFSIIWLLEYLGDEGFYSIPISRIRRRLKTIKTPKPEDQPVIPVPLLDETIDMLKEKRSTSARRDLVALLIMKDAWLRVGEVCRIRLNDLEPNSNQLHIRGKGGVESSDGKRITAVTKLSQETWGAIADYINNWRLPATGETNIVRFKELPGGNDTFLSSNRGNRMNEETLRINIVRYLRKSALDTGIKMRWQRIGPHAIRRTMASKEYNSRNMTLREVQVKLRHANIDTTSRYLILGSD